jgi:hypothetical protein
MNEMDPPLCGTAVISHNEVSETDGSVSNVEMMTSMALIYKVLFPSISTFETLPQRVTAKRIDLADRTS